MRKQILKPRKTGEERKGNYKVSIEKRIKKYIKDGSKGDLDLSRTPIEKLPDNLKVGGSLDLDNTPIERLPDNLQVGGGLYLDNTPIKELPDNLQVGSDLYLDNTPIKELPDNLQVGGILFLTGTPIKELPDNLKVGGLLLQNTPLSKKYSEEEIISIIEERGGYVKGIIVL